MTRLPRISGRQLIAKLKRLGFEVVRVRGSHHLLKHPDGRMTVVPLINEAAAPASVGCPRFIDPNGCPGQVRSLPGGSGSGREDSPLEAPDLSWTRARDAEAAASVPAGCTSNPSNGEDELASRVPLREIANGLGSLGERVGSVDDGCYLAALEEPLQKLQVLLASCRDERP